MPSTKGSCTGSSGSKYNLYIVYNLATPPGGGNSQDIANNRSYINVKTTLQRNDGYNASAYNNDPVNRVILTVAGTQRVNTLRGIDTRNQALVTLAEWSGWANHNSDGSLTISVSGSFTMEGTSLTGGSVSASWTLTTIPRASTVSASTNSAELGTVNAVTFAIDRKSSSFTHTLRYKVGSAEGVIGSEKTTSTSIAWSPPLSLAYQVVNSYQGNCIITLQTYNGNTLIGTSQIAIYVKVPHDLRPNPGVLNFEPINGDVPSNWGVYVQGKSKVKITNTGASGVYGSTIKSRSIGVASDYYSTGSELTTGFLNTPGYRYVQCTVTDSRDRVSSVDSGITVEPWSTPKINTLTVQRCTAAGVPNDEGLYFKVYCSYTFSSVAGKNAASAKVAYELNGSGIPIQSNIPIGNGIESVPIGPISADNSYQITVTVSDQFATTTMPKILPTAKVILDFKTNGRGMAIGKVSELDDTFECDWLAKFSNGLESDVLKGNLITSNAAASDDGINFYIGLYVDGDGVMRSTSPHYQYEMIYFTHFQICKISSYISGITSPAGIRVRHGSYSNQGGTINIGDPVNPSWGTWAEFWHNMNLPYWQVKKTPYILPSSADLNSYTTPGYYGTTGYSHGLTLSNRPSDTDGFFILEVTVHADEEYPYIMQEIKEYIGYKEYRRYKNYGTSGAWSAWRKVGSSMTSTSVTLSNGSNSHTLNLRRVGNLVFADWAGWANFGVPGSTYVTLGTIPSGWRPIREATSSVWKTNNQIWLIIVGTNGTVTGHNSGGIADLSGRITSFHWEVS